MEELGFRWRGEHGLPGRRYCTLDDPKTRSGGCNSTAMPKTTRLYVVTSPSAFICGFDPISPRSRSVTKDAVPRSTRTIRVAMQRFGPPF